MLPAISMARIETNIIFPGLEPFDSAVGCRGHSGLLFAAGYLVSLYTCIVGEEFQLTVIWYRIGTGWIIRLAALDSANRMRQSR
jgi:hypothetical protein